MRLDFAGLAQSAKEKGRRPKRDAFERLDAQADSSSPSSSEVQRWEQARNESAGLIPGQCGLSEFDADAVRASSP